MAQSSSPVVASGTIAGRVIDAESAAPLAGSVVMLQSLSRSGGTQAVVRSLARTDSLGNYAFTRLAAGRYQISVERLGYVPTAVEVELQPSATAQVSLGLNIHPVEMPGVDVVGEAAPPFVRAAPGQASVSGARRSVAQVRQATYLASDARALTRADVAEAVTLGEADLFRAIQRIPGVTTRDDFTAVLWTRGAPWDQTRVYFDELPLYNPTHTGWLFSAVNADGLGSVVFQPGVRSAQWGEGAAGVLDLRSRPGGRDALLDGSAELSLVSARLALEGGLWDGRIGWMFAGRRTYVDWFSRALPVFEVDDQGRVPYDFADVIGRIDIRGANGWSLELSGMLEEDRVRGDLPGYVEGNHATWGNRVQRAALSVPLGEHLMLRLSRGRTQFSTRVDEDSLWRAGAGDSLATLPTMNAAIRHDRTALRLESRQRGPHAAFEWALGAELLEDTTQYAGPWSLLQEVYRRRTREWPEGWSVLYFRESSRHRYRAFWGEVTQRPMPWLSTQLGVRVEAGDSVRNGGRVRPAPRALVQVQPWQHTRFTGGWGRSFQYTQAIHPAAGPLGPELHLGNAWVVASAKYPALRADVMMLGAEHWLGDRWLLSANVYRRDADGLAIADPTPLAPDDWERIGRREAPHVPAVNWAHGFELSARRLAGRWTGSAGYAYGRSWFRTEPGYAGIGVVAFPSPADVRHSVDLLAMTQLADGLRVGGALSYATGVPFTRIAIAEDGGWTGMPNAERAPNYASLDGLAEYSMRLGGVEWTGSLQLRNVLNRRNAVTYAGSDRSCPIFGDPEAGCGAPQYTDQFQRGLPRLLLASVRVAF